MSMFVLEIGTEELPARFLAPEQAALETLFSQGLKEAKLDYGRLEAWTTPRRAALTIWDVASRQEQTEEVVLGPGVRICYDENKNPTKALQGFLRSQGIEQSALFEQTTDKGVYVAYTRKTGGLLAKDILAKLIGDVVPNLPFAKRMRWGSGSFAYARPMHWILALLDEDIVPVQLGLLHSDRITFGHRIHGLGPFSVARAQDY
ncbi:MAG: glycine--tRNA ligase subunit beta, partial [Desulfovibrio sp.]|nr:glycine--tRNA ligase subunit beta [Desulfovibrio sp.]